MFFKHTKISIILHIFLFSLFLLSVLSFSTFAIEGNLENFEKSYSYEENHFIDVSQSDWFFDGVQSAYEYGLMQGDSESTFNPNGQTKIAEALAMACRIHNIYYGENGVFSNGSPWYQPYVDYAIENNIIEDGDYSDYTLDAKRSDFARIIFLSLPSEAWKEINHVEQLPDVKSDDWFAEPVFSLYNAGILTGNDEYGTFNPDSNIKRSEVATIITRVASSESRKVFTLKDSPIYPTSIKIIGDKNICYLDETLQLSLLYDPDNTNVLDAEWFSSDENVAVVSGNGIVAPVGKGSAVITAVTPNNARSVFAVTVEKRDPIKIFYTCLRIDSAEGVKVDIAWKNVSRKTIKYATFVVTPYNAVDDIVSSEIGGLTTARLKVTGPVDPFDINGEQSISYFMEWTSKYTGKTSYGSTVYRNEGLGNFYYLDYNTPNHDKVYIDESDMDNCYDRISIFKSVWYNGTVAKIKIEQVEIEYMDGTTDIVENPTNVVCWRSY